MTIPLCFIKLVAINNEHPSYESDSSMTNKVYDTNLMLIVFLNLKKVGNLSFITFGHMKQLTPISKSLHFNA